MSRIFRGDRSQISVGEYVSLHLALGNDPAGQLTKLIAASYPAPANMQQYFAVEYSAVTGLPILHNGQLASTELGQHSTDQDAINHARTLLPVAANIGPLLQGSDSKRWTIFTAAELNNLIAEIE